MARSIKRIPSQKHRTMPSYSPKIQEKKNLVWDCRRWGFNSASSSYKYLWVTVLSVKTRNTRKISHKVFLGWRRLSRLKIILLKTENAVALCWEKLSCSSQCRDLITAPWNQWESPAWQQSSEQAPLLQGTKSIPLLSSARLERQSLRQDSAINNLRKRFTKMPFWRTGNTDDSSQSFVTAALPRDDKCSLLHWEMEREKSNMSSCFYYIMLLSNLWKISDIKRNLWGECEQAFWNRFIQKKMLKVF